MKKRIIKILFPLSVILGLSFSLTACQQNPTPYSFMHGFDEIQEIQIIHIELQNKYQSFRIDMIDDCKILADIEDNSEFIEKFNNDVLFSKYLLGDPPELDNGDYAIKVTYINGDFELIGYYAQCKGRREETDNGGSRYAAGYGYVYCDKGDFINFINLYLDEPVQ